MKGQIAKLWAYFFVKSQKKWSSSPVSSQEKVFQELVSKAKNTEFGKAHRFSSIRTYNDFQEAVSLRSYEAHIPYVNRICEGNKDVLWPGKPKYFAETSGTTAHTKYIPITSDSLPYHIHSARAALLNYVYTSGRTDFLNGHMLFLSGSPELHLYGGVLTGRLSGIVNHHVPSYLQPGRSPSEKVNRISDFEEKIKAIVKESTKQSVSLLAGIPPWVQNYLDELCKHTAKKSVLEIFPKLSLYVHGGVNFSPYERRLTQTIGQKIPTIELYPASEGFFAYQDLPDPKAGLLLLLSHGMFYEFVPLKEIDHPSPRRYTISEVKTDTPYAMIVSSNAGLWGYVVGDVVSFTSLSPYRLRVVGRTKHFLSAFGEHVIAEEVEASLSSALRACPEAELLECTVAPQISPKDGLPHHEWWIAFARPPQDTLLFAKILDEKLQEKNPYYEDLRKGAVLSSAKLVLLREDAFVHYMKAIGKLEAQSKVPRLSNDRKIADALQSYIHPNFQYDT